MCHKSCLADGSAYKGQDPFQMALGVSVLYSIVADFMAVGDSRVCFQLPCLSSTAEKGFCQGLAALAVPAALTGSLPCCIAQSVCSVIIPQIKQDSSLAIAVFATFGFFPFPSTIW